jgi:hypothetical protein
MGVITQVGRKDNKAMGRSIARSVGHTSKGKDIISSAEVRPCRGEQRKEIMAHAFFDARDAHREKQRASIATACLPD